MTDRTYSTTEILAITGDMWYRLNYLVITNQVTPLNRHRGKERRFSETETLKAVNILLGKNLSSLKGLEVSQVKRNNQIKGDNNCGPV